MNPTQVALVSLVLLLLSTGIESYSMEEPEPPTYLSRVQDILTKSWEQVGSKTHELVEKVRMPAVEEKIKEAYEQGTHITGTYLNIFVDQMYHWWQGK
ncbi:apolipoprotein C-II [Pelodytes ibericus]